PGGAGPAAAALGRGRRGLAPPGHDPTRCASAGESLGRGRRRRRSDPQRQHPGASGNGRPACRSALAARSLDRVPPGIRLETTGVPPMTTALGSNMTLDEKRTEAKARLDEASGIEEKHLVSKTTLTGPELEQVKRLLAEVDVLHQAIQAEEETRGLVEKTRQMADWFAQPVLPSQAIPGGAFGGGGRHQLLSPGEQFIRHRAYKGRVERHAFDNSLNYHDFGVPLAEGTSLLQWKATLSGSVSTSGGALVANDVRPGIVDILPRIISVLDLLPRIQT